MNPIYNNLPLALLTDLYEVTMAYGYWKRKMEDHEAVFQLFFRKQPFGSGFTIAAGLKSVIDYIQSYRFQTTDLDYLATLRGADGEPLFEEGFLKYLSALKFEGDLDAVEEGDVVFPYEPLIRVKGPLIACQLLESPLLTLTNFASLIATKATRVCMAAGSDPVLEFGLRRAQGIDGALTATRSCFLGGCAATSNLLGGKLFDIPVAGTNAHSWIMAFDTEIESFQAYAEAMPNNAVFLVDTYDSLEGIENAIVVGHWLKKRGKAFLGVRLDSGDLAYLSIKARKMLDAAGFPETKIYASNELDEILIADLKAQGAKIAVWGVGTNLVTGGMQGSLGGVYKLSALRKKGEEWKYKLKLSEHLTKTTNPGLLGTRRYWNADGYVADMIYNTAADCPSNCKMVDPFDSSRQKVLSGKMEYRLLEVPIFREGKLVYKEKTLLESKGFAKAELGKFDQSIKRFHHPHLYPVGMESGLYELKTALMHAIRVQLKKDS